MEENILRIIQLALAINQSSQTDIRVLCGVHIRTNGYIEVRIYGKKFCSVSRFQLCYHPAHYDSKGMAECLRCLENICYELGIDTSERYIKVQVC